MTDLDGIRKPFDDLARTLRLRASGRRVVFLVGDGNLGDGLIRLGAEHFLRDAGFDAPTITLNSKQAKLRALSLGASDPFGRRYLFVHNGGGGWAQHCSVAQRGVELQMRVCADVVVLPSTIEQLPLRRTPTIFRRDESESATMAPDAPFCHDMALYLALLPEQAWFPEVDSITVDRQVGVFFRGDNESRLHGDRLEGNLDISALGFSADDVSPFLRHIARCEEVVTDRLHVGIAATLLGKQVWMVPGLTWKIRAIHETSIAPYFSNCHLVDDEEALARVRAGARG